MKLNKDKCNYIATRRNNKLKFPDGQPLESVDKATYLGGTLTNDVSATTEINNRAQHQSLSN